MTTPSFADAVATAVNELRIEFSPAVVTAEPDGEGGAHVRLDPVELGSPILQKTTWVAFRIPYNYPYADVYPHFVRPDLRVDGGALSAGMSQVQFLGVPAVQLSRRSNRRVAESDTAAVKLRKVVSWLSSTR